MACWQSDMFVISWLSHTKVVMGTNRQVVAIYGQRKGSFMELERLSGVGVCVCVCVCVCACVHACACVRVRACTCVCVRAPTEAVDGSWSCWGPWDECGAAMKRQRRRSCDNPAPMRSGQPCQGASMQKELCHSSIFQKYGAASGCNNNI